MRRAWTPPQDSGPPVDARRSSSASCAVTDPGRFDRRAQGRLNNCSRRCRPRQVLTPTGLAREPFRRAVILATQGREARELFRAPGPCDRCEQEHAFGRVGGATDARWGMGWAVQDEATDADQPAELTSDECRSKKGKNPKGVKCPGGYKHNIKSGADTCTKTTQEHETPTCPAGYNYKSLNGKDECREK